MTAHTRRLALTIYAVVGSILALLLLVHAARFLGEAWRQYPYDGKVDWIAARAFWDHRNPYSPAELHRVHLDGLGHPPTTSFWFLPFADIPLLQISPVVGLVIAVAMLLMFLLLADELRWPLPALSALLLFGVVMASSWMSYHFALVQVSGFIAFLYFLVWYVLRRGHDVAAGVLLGLACTFKLFPGLMVLMLLFARRWRAVAAAVAAWLAIAALMTARFGLESWPQYAATEHVIADFWIGNFHNASLFGITLRVLVPSCMATIKSTPLCTAAAVLIGLVLVRIAWGVSRRALAAGDFDLPFAMFAVLSVFLNPFTFEHYFALLVFPVCLLATATLGAARLGMPRRDVAGIGGLLLLATLLLSFDYRWKDQLTWHQHRLRHAVEVANWAHMPLIFAAGGLLLVWSDRKGGAVLLPPPRAAKGSAA